MAFRGSVGMGWDGKVEEDLLGQHSARRDSLCR